MLTLISLPALGLAIVVEAAWLAQPVPILLRALPAALALLSIVRPAAGLTALAGFGPLAGAIATWAGSPPSSGPFLEQLVLAVIVGTTLRLWRHREPLRLSVAATLFGAIAAASAVAAQPELLIRASPGLSIGDHLRSLVAGAYFLREPTWQPLHAAALIIEGLALAVVTERVLRVRPPAPSGVLNMLVVGTAALATLNLVRLVEVAARTGDIAASVPELLLRVRISRFYDVNAAAFVFLITLLAGIGSALQPRRWRGLFLPLALLAVGLWVTGSRAALAAFVLVSVAALMTSLATTPRRTMRWVSLLGIGVVLAVTAAGVTMYPDKRNMNASGAFAARRIMAQTSFNMWRSAPVLGVGVGRFHAESSRFGGVALREELDFGVINENAHNNFLQVLAEQGVVGLAALLFVIGGVLAAAVNAERAATVPQRRWLLFALAAGLITWLTGHPLLVPEAAFVFWLLLGVLAAMTASPGAPGWPVRGAAAAIAVALLVSAPLRASAAVADLDLEHIGAGVTVWHTDAAGQRYREAGATFALYLPADGSTVVLPVRRAAGAPDPLRLAFSARGQVLNEVAVAGVDWQRVFITLQPRGRRFELVHFAVTSAHDLPHDRPLVQVGRGR